MIPALLNKERRDKAKIQSAFVQRLPSAATSKTHRSPGLLRTRNIAIVAILLLALVIGFRRRAVKRQRMLRLARRRQRISAMRSGSLPVVDGRYRTGTRIGPPVESHVRVRAAPRPTNRRGTA